MVDIFSKQKGPRREDVIAKGAINRNWPTITRLADQISNGGYTKSRQAMAKAREKPKPDSSNLYRVGSAGKSIEQEPIVRISTNQRVIVFDLRTGKQLQYLGKIRYQNGQKYFALATEKNGFFATVDADTEEILANLDGVIIETDNIEKMFLGVIKDRLGV